MLKLLAGSFLACLAVEHFVPPADGDRTDADVSRGVWLCLLLAANGTGFYRRFRRHFAAQNQRHQRLCRLDRLVEFLFASDAQPSRPRGLAGLQRHYCAGVDGARHLQDARARAWSLFDRRGRPGSARWSPTSSSTNRLGSVLPDIEFRRAHLYDINPVGVGAMLAAVAAGIAAFCGVFGAIAQSLSRVPGIGSRICHGATHRLGDERALLRRSPAAAKLGRPACDLLLDLRASFRERGHGALPRLFRGDLLAVLLAGNPLPRLLQAARPHLQSVCRLVRAKAARARHLPARYSNRPLPSCAWRLRRRDRRRSLLGLFAGVPRHRWTPRTDPGNAVDGFFHPYHHRRRRSPGSSCWRRKAATSPRRKRAARPIC